MHGFPPESPVCCDAAWCSDCDTRQIRPRQRATESYWVDVDYLNWDLRGIDVPVLVSTSPSGTLQEDAGVLGDASTSVLVGNRALADGEQSGGSVSLGFWLDRSQQIGLEYTYTGLGDHTESFRASSDSSTILARPFFNVAEHREDARLLGFPNTLSGDVQIDASTEYFAQEILLLYPVSRHRRWQINFAAGYRTTELNDSLAINDSSLVLSGITAGTSINISEQFESRNEFHGFEGGLLTRIQLPLDWRLEIDAKVAFGETDHSNRMIARTVTTTASGQSASSESGLLVQPSNFGTHATSSYSVQHDLAIMLRRNLGWGVSGNIGYSIHHWTDVTRAGDQIDRQINPTQIPPGTLSGAARPSVNEVTSDFIAQGLTAGIEWTW